MEPTIIELASGTDERGFSIKPFEGKQLDAVFNIHLVSLNPGTTRGNHFHPTQTEYIFVLGKQGKLVTVDSVTDKRSETVINGEKCPRIVIPPQIAHAIKNTSSEQMYLLCYTDSPLIPERDVIKKVLLK
jgi:dTDP-4-dehydrorhamnose 3,5-epimerase-like enzyme